MEWYVVLTLVILFLILILLIANFLFNRNKKVKSNNEMVDLLKSRIEELNAEVKTKDEHFSNLYEEKSCISSERDVLGSTVESLRKEMEALRNEYENRIIEGKTLHDKQVFELRDSHEREINELQRNHDKEINELKNNYGNSIKELKENHKKEIDTLVGNYNDTISSIKEASQKQLHQIKENNEVQINALREMNKNQVENQLNLIKEQMKTTSEEILKQRQEELGEKNKEQVMIIVDPLMKSLKDMKEAFDRAKEQQNEAFTRLDSTIKMNSEKSAALGETADRLARALTGEVKVQGNFGELKLKQLLESMELHEGEQYDTQSTLRDHFGQKAMNDEGRGLIPDFILHFPDNRHVVVDSKMSLTAFERYINAEDGTVEKSNHLKAHLNSVRTQMKNLASKAYAKYLPKDCNRLDFAFMYVPIEGALNLALLNDSTLWKDAYDMGVIILGPQTMYMNLRILEMMWTQTRQLENQQTMIDSANNIIERVQDFALRFRDVDESMRTVIGKIDKFKITIAPQGQGIITAARKLIKAGGQENKKKVSLEKIKENMFTADDSSLFLESSKKESMES